MYACEYGTVAGYCAGSRSGRDEKIGYQQLRGRAVSAAIGAVVGPKAPRQRQPANSISWAVLFATCLVMALLLFFFLRAGKETIFDTFWASGAALLHGMNPYAAYPLAIQSHLQMPGAPQIAGDINLNPPFMLPLFQVLAHLTLPQFTVVWTAGSFLLLTFTICLLLVHNPMMQKRQILWLLLASPMTDTLLSGQIYFLLLLLAALAWISIDDGRELPAAVMIGLLVAMRPTLFFCPAFLFLAGRRRLALRSLAVTLAISVAPILLYGPRIYREWLAALANDPHWIFTANIAIAPLFRRLGFYPLGIALAFSAALGLAWLVWRKKPDANTAIGIGYCAGILCAPLAWSAYAILLAPGFVSRRWNIPSDIAAVLLIVPSAVTAFISGSRIGMVFGTGFSLVAVSIILAAFLRELSQQSDRQASSSTAGSAG